VEDGKGNGDSSDDGGDGRDKNHRSDEGALVPVKKGVGEDGVSKNEHVEVVKIACPDGRMRGETPNKE
jgi:hypothetical protein